MFGVYFHIPFCKSKCGYCDFYSITSLSSKDSLLQAMLAELEQQQAYIPAAVRQQGKATIYFGGGTPSVLAPHELGMLAHQAMALLGISEVAEWTVEANPDDLSPAYLRELRRTGANRLSMGVQSFVDPHLQQANRRHSAAQAVDAIKMAQDNGFANLSIDLMYGLPHMQLAHWEQSLQQAMSLQVPHLSAYSLIVEPNTPFGRQLKQGQLILPPEEELIAQNQLLNQVTLAHGYQRYEISNFAQPGQYALHNTAYWQQHPYVGIGPSAHSFDGVSRQHNLSSIARYTQGLMQGTPYYRREQLSTHERYNEMVFTGLRTQWGIDLEQVQQQFGSALAQYARAQARPHLQAGRMRLEGAILRIPQDYMILADGIIVDLIWPV